MTAINFIELTTATLAGAAKRAVRIGTVADAEVTRIYDPETYAGRFDKRGGYYAQQEFWHDGERFIGEDDRPLYDSHFIHPGQWRALREFESQHYGTFDYGDCLTIAEAFQPRVGDAVALAPFWHADRDEAPGQRMYLVGSRIQQLNVEYPLGDMRLQDATLEMRQAVRHLRLTDQKAELEKFKTLYYDHGDGIGQNGANAVIVAPLDGQHRSSPYRAHYPNEAFYFGRMGVVRAGL